MAGVLVALAAAAVGAGPADAQDGTSVGRLLAQHERLPDAHPGRVIIESAVGNYALGLVDHARRTQGGCDAYAGSRRPSADGLFLAWRESVVGADEPQGLDMEWRRAVRDWVDERCAP